MMNETENNDIILMDYYKGAYGPTIRVNTRSVKALTQIKGLFLELAAAKISETSFNEIGSMKVIGIKALVLKFVPESKEQKKTLKLVQVTPEGPVFHWSRSSEGWMECAGLIDGLLEYQRPAHQYLTDESVDDALVEVAFLEA